MSPRYEDITQDGRVHLASLMTGLGAVWRSLSDGSRVRTMMERGVVPILSRIVMLGEEGPFSPDIPFEVEGTWRLARETNGDRLFLDMWLDAYAPHQRHFQPRVSGAPRARVGRVYAEHVVTRPFEKDPTKRKVTKLEVPGLPALPAHEHEYAAAAALVAGAHLEPASTHLFGMMHTDSNQHVNSLVYPRLFEEAVSRRAIERKVGEKPETLLARAIELRYRKPFFAGDAAHLAFDLQPGDGGMRAAGVFAPSLEGPPSTVVAMTLR